jgi:RHS repeat-associated protein
MNKNVLAGIVVSAALACTETFAATDWSTQDYDLYPGDFNADGYTDLLYIAKDASDVSGIAVSNGTAPNVPWQTWPANYLGIPWSGNAYAVTVADFSGDGRADVFLQRKVSGDHYLLIANAAGKITAISQTVPNSHLGLTWSADTHRVVAGDFNGDGRADLFLQATSAAGLNAVVTPNAAGQFTSGPAQSWSEGFLGFRWNTKEAIAYAGDFNGDLQADLLLQAKPKFVMIDYEIPIPVPTYPPNLNGVLYAQASGALFQLAGAQAWSRNAFGVDWSPLTADLVFGDFDGNGRADVILQSRNGYKPTYLVSGNAGGSAFATGTVLDANVSWGGNAYRLLAGNFDGGSAAGVYFQALSPSGSNYYANTITGTVTVSSHSPTAPTGVVPATAVGHTPGSFAITDMGAATYSIPIVVPPGVAGIQPSLAIAYQSGAENGLLGVGWSLASFSSIQRCRKTLVQDNSSDGVLLTTADRFCLDGNKLRLTSGTYGVAGSTYQTEIEHFSRVTASGTAGNGPASFIVEAKDGLRYEFGATSDSRIEPTGSATPHTWALNRVSDRAGNAMLISYHDDTANGSFRPNEMVYTSNSSAGLAAAYKVVFHWETRPANDTLTEYVAGSLVRETQRLNRVETLYNDPQVSAFRLVRRYQLSYNTSGSTPRSRLSSIQECDRNGYCLAPTMISWQDGISAWSASDTVSATNSAAVMEQSQAVDIDADGRVDLLYPQANKWWYMRANASGGFDSPINSNIDAGPEAGYAQPFDYDSSGRRGLLVNVPGFTALQVLRLSGSTLVRTATNITLTMAGREWVGDFDGDGREDVLYGVQASGTGTLNVRRNLGGASFAAAQAFHSFSIGTSWSMFSTTNADTDRIIDFNGDGRADFLYQTTSGGCGPTACASITTWNALASTGSAFTSVASWQCISAPGNACNLFPIIGDFNADRLTDVMNVTSQTPSVTGAIRFGSGLGLSSVVSISLPSTFSTVGAAAADYDSDGQTDILYPPTSGSGTWHIIRSNGSGFESPVATTIPLNTSWTNTVRILDINGDGQQDVGYEDAQYRVRKHEGAFPDMVRSVTDGFGNSVSYAYAPLTDSTLYTKGSSATFPEMDLQWPAHIVKQLTSTDGIGGSYTVTATYSGLRSHLQGRGFTGFAARTEVDSRSGIKTAWTYRQDFPYLGMPSSVVATQPNTNTITASSLQYSNLITSSQSFNERIFPYVSSKTDTNNEVSASNPSVDGLGISQVVTTTSLHSTSGSPATITVTTTDLTGTGQTFTTQTVNSFATDDVPNWCLGFTTQQTVTKTLPNASSLTRTVQFVKDAAAPAQCRAQQQIVEPTQAPWTVTTTYGFDSLGHITTETVTATGISARTTTTSYGSQGVAPVSMTNAANETTSRTHDYALGVSLTETDANGLQTVWQNDGFGRRIRETRPDGTATAWVFSPCSVANGYCGDTLLRYQIFEQKLDTTGVGVIRTAIQRFDSLGRAKYQESQGFSGAFAVVRTLYDNEGHIAQRSQPHFAGFAPYYTTFTYDLIGRAILEQRQVSETDATLQSSVTSYARLTHSVTDPNSKVTTKISNALGETVQVTDSGSGVTQFEYDPFGNLTKTIDPAGNQDTATYNVRGFKMTSSDPDMGSWSYDYFPTGELKTQTDAVPRTMTFTYDGVSRPLTRVELEGTTTFGYGTSAANRNIGKLVQHSSPGFTEVFTYDSFGRSQNTTTTIDSTNFVVSNAYHPTTGLLEFVTYPTSTTAVPGSRFKVKHEYANGLLQRVVDANTPATIYWEQIATDAAGRTIDEQFGNGLHTFSTYDDVTGFLASRFTGASSQIQNLSYLWDKVGNLTERKDLTLSLTERFFYDNLYRLDYSTLNSVTNVDLAYNAIGNITSKSDVGSYTYHATKKHAVIAAGGQSFAYDANGNMTTRNGSTITWTSYNLPSLINQGSSSTQFWYGASRARYKEVTNTAAGGPLPAGTETTLYVGGIFEKVTKPSGVIEFKHYVMAGQEAIALRTLRNSGVNDTRYLHKDHLGSVDTITDESAAVVVKLSFDAFGKRRSPATWAGAPSSGDWTSIAAITHRGFTFHEGLDNVGLVHMNGRVYDPTIGRFLSADPNIQDVTNSQMLNRYSYVTNNPLSYTDPSGFFLKKLFKAIGKFLKKWWKPILAIVVAVVSFGYLAPVMSQMLVTTACLAPGAITLGGAMLAGGIAGALGGAIMGGAKGAVAGFFTGAMLGGIGAAYGNSWSVGRVLSEGAVSGIGAEIQGGSFADGFRFGAGFSLLQWGAYEMRQAMVEQSSKNPLNSSGKSAGAFDDGFKAGGGRAPEGVTKLTDFEPSMLGGRQGGAGRIGLPRFGFDYAPESFWDHVVESYAGPHDWMSSFRYNANGNLKVWNSWLARAAYGVWGGVTIPPATPFAFATAVPARAIAPTLRWDD